MENYVLENEKLRAVVREQSAELISLRRKDNDQEYLWNADPRFWGWTSPVLFPAVGSFVDNQYHYQGKTYTMAQHGFARRRNFTLVSRKEDEIWMSLEDDADSYAVYPFHFRLEIGYRLNDATIEVLWKVINKDDTEMYFAIGGHPAIMCPMDASGEKKECYIGLEGDSDAMHYLSVDLESGRIGNTLAKFPMEHQMHKVTEETFRYDTVIFEDYQVKTAFLAGADQKPYIKMHTDMPLIAFWTPKTDAPFICVEPWHGRADDVDFHGTLEERAWEEKLEGHGVFETAYQLEIVM